MADKRTIGEKSGNKKVLILNKDDGVKNPWEPKIQGYKNHSQHRSDKKKHFINKYNI